MSPFRARLTVALLFVIGNVVTFGLGDDPTFEKLPFVLQTLTFLCAIITGIGWALGVLFGLAFLLSRCFYSR